MARAASAKRYAEALFQLAREQGVLDRVQGELSEFAGALQSAEVRAFLESARVPAERKLAVVGQSMSHASQLSRNFIGMMVSQGLVDLIPGVIAEYQRLLDAFHGRQRALVISAVPLGQQEKSQVSGYLGKLVGKQIVLDTRVEPQVLGGLVIRLGDKLIDGSTRGKLQALKQKLITDSRVAAG